MTTIQLIQVTVDYIEANLKSELSIIQLADLVGFSPYHFSRLFCSVVGMPVCAYITKRRLYHGIYAIQNGTKMIDAALDYGFHTHAGFYKAFLKEFGCSPRKYLKLSTATRPVAVDLSKEGKYMLTQTQIKQLLTNWNIDRKLDIGTVPLAGGARKSHETWAIGDNYIFKTGKNIAGLKTHIAISKALVKNGMNAAIPVPTKTGADFVTEDDRYFVLTHKVKGDFVTPEARYAGDRFTTGEKYGQAIAKLHQVLATQDRNIEADDNNLLDTVLNWALPKTKRLMEQWNCPLPETFYQDYITTFAKIYPDLPRHIIHRDPNPSNIMFENGEVTGFIDFIISERNVRIFDPCYCATGILSEAGSIDGGLKKWPEILKGIITGYKHTIKLTEAEIQAIPYIIYSIHLIFIAWLDRRDEFKDIALQNREMLAWLWNNSSLWS